MTQRLQSENFRSWRNSVQQVDSYRLHFGRDILELPQLITPLLEGGNAMSEYFCTRKIPLGSEAELLLSGVLHRDHSRSQQSVRKFQEPLDWASFLQMAEYHGVEPLIYATLSKCAPDLVPAEALIRLRQKVQVGGLLNRSLAQELIKLCDEFALRGVPIIPIKGATLATVAYGDLCP